MNLDWLSLLIGVLIGWVIEWLIDLFYWRRKNADLAASEAALREQLAASEDAVRQLQIELANAQASYQGELDDLNAQLAAARRDLEDMITRTREVNSQLSTTTAELDTLRAQFVVISAENEELRARVAVLEAAPEEAPVIAAVPEPKEMPARAAMLEPEDDLTIIEGIGPKIAAYLNQRDIHTLEQVAAMDPEDLHGLLKDGGPGIASANTETWPRQAQLAARREWTKLMALQASIGGSARQATRTPEVDRDDNLTIIEGIGPKIEAVLKANGIHSFGQLAVAEPDRLKEILMAAGPQFNVADPETWPLQAGLAFEGLWERLEELQERLRAGREPG